LLPRLLCMCPRSAPPPHLHSFPTRRSSDLAVDPLATGDPVDALDALDTVDPVDAAGPQRRGEAGVAALGRPGRGWEGRLAVLTRDRKSTRLNSSHVKTSYAVFCLKKNTTYR